MQKNVSGGCGLLIAACVFGIVVAPTRIVAQAAVPNLAGSWILNRNLSEFPNEVGFGVDLPTDVAGDTARSGGGGRGTGTPPLPNRIPPPQSMEDVAKADELVGEVRNPSPSLTIEQGATGISVTGADGKMRVFHTTGKKDIQTLNSAPINTTTKWIGAQLVVLYEVDRQRQLRYTYEVNADRSRLQVRAQLMRNGRGGVITRVYEPAVAAR